MQKHTPSNLLYGMLALQLDLINLSDLQTALDACTAAGRNVKDVLIELQLLSDRKARLVGELVEAHLKYNNGNATDCLDRIVNTELDPATVIQLTKSFDFEPNSGSASSEDVEASGSLSVSNLRLRKIRSHAKGGFGEVSLARDEQIKRDVALKELQARYRDSEERKKQFVLEGELTGALEHPNIVPVYAMGVDPQGSPFYAMRFVRGQSLARSVKQAHQQPLKKLLRRDNIEFRRLLQRFVAVCRAMSYAHSRGVIHQDVKPANIMIGKHDETYLVDWGLARPLTDASDDVVADEEFLGNRDENLVSREGRIIGTPGYMSPEQALGRARDQGPWSDVYSLGATLFFILTAEIPINIQEKSWEEYLQCMEAGRLTKPRQIHKEVPPELEAVCLKAMATQVEKRYQTAGELADEIERWLGDRPVDAGPRFISEQAGRWLRNHRSSVVAGLVSTTVLASIGLYAMQVFRKQADRERQLLVETRKLAAKETQAKEQVRELYLDARENVDRWLIGYTTALQDYPELDVVSEEMLEQAAKEYSEFAFLQVDDPTLRLEQGRTLLRLGELELYRSTHKHEEARNAFQAAITVFEGLEQNDVAKVASARAKGNLALIASREADYAAAEQLFVESYLALQPIADSEEATIESRSNLVSVLTNRGRTLRLAGNARAAIPILDEALRRCVALVQADSKLDHQREEATVHLALGQTYLSIGEAAKAKSPFEVAVARFQTLSQLPSDSIRQLRRSAAIAYTNLAEAASRLGKSLEARQAHESAISIYDDLCEAQPNAATYRRELAITEMSLGQLQLHAGEHKMALKRLERAVSLLHNLCLENPGDQSCGNAYVMALVNWSAAFAVSGQTDLATNVAKTALENIQLLVDERPESEQLLYSKAIALKPFSTESCHTRRRRCCEKSFSGSCGDLSSAV